MIYNKRRSISIRIRINKIFIIIYNNGLTSTFLSNIQIDFTIKYCYID